MTVLSSYKILIFFNETDNLAFHFCFLEFYPAVYILNFLVPTSFVFDIFLFNFLKLCF